jgi:hypothetical protein
MAKLVRKNVFLNPEVLRPDFDTNRYIFPDG